MWYRYILSHPWMFCIRLAIITSVVAYEHLRAIAVKFTWVGTSGTFKDNHCIKIQKIIRKAAGRTQETGVRISLLIGLYAFFSIWSFTYMTSSECGKWQNKAGKGIQRWEMSFFSFNFGFWSFSTWRVRWYNSCTVVLTLDIFWLTSIHLENGAHYTPAC